MSEKVSLGLVDDHQIVLDGLISILKDEPNFQVQFATTHPTEAIKLIAANPIDVLLTDVLMPELPGNILAREIKRKFPAIKILALSMIGEASVVNEMIDDADISGYVLKNIGKKELVSAIEKITKGGIYFSEEVLAELGQLAQNKKENGPAHLTKREIEILRLIEKEYNNKQVAEILFISERTVETHRKNIFRKTNTSSVIGLIKYAYEHKLI